MEQVEIWILEQTQKLVELIHEPLNANSPFFFALNTKSSGQKINLAQCRDLVEQVKRYFEKSLWKKFKAQYSLVYFIRETYETKLHVLLVHFRGLVEQIKGPNEINSKALWNKLRGLLA